MTHDDEAYQYDSARERAASKNPLIPQAFDWGITGSILAIIVLTVIYTLSPVDTIPDIIPVAGQVDDLAAILAGSSSVTFLAVLRFVMRSRVARWGCLLVIVLSAIGGLTIFLVLLRVLNSIF